MAEQFNVEFRATDGAANPYLVLGVLVRAGLEGTREGLAAEAPYEGDPEELDPAEARRLGIERLPTSLPAALDRFSAAGRDLLPPALADAFVAIKQAEIAELADASPGEAAARYRAVF